MGYSPRSWVFAVGVLTALAARVPLVPRAAHGMIVWGDVHAHSGLSDDALGSPAEFFLRARDEAKLDFVVLSDHDIWLTADEWLTLKTVAEAFDEPGRFVAFPGVEWTRVYHMNAYFLHDDDAICGGGGGPPCDSAEDFLNFYGPRVLAGEAAAHVNHPSWDVRWEQIDDTTITNVEIWNTLWDRVYAGRGVHSDDPGFGGVLWALQAGLRFGFVGASDNHLHPFLGGALLGTGLTACHVDRLTRGDILQALRDRRCYGTNGERILVDFDVEGTPMGGQLTAPLHAAVTAQVRVTGTATPTAIELVRNGSVVARRTDCATPSCNLTAAVEVADEYTFVYARISQPGSRRAWASPIWIQGTCARPGDCPAERVVPRNAGPPTGHLAVWRVLPRADRSPGGRRVRRVRCVDGDPTCDFGKQQGECTFRVGICLGVPGARPPGRQARPPFGYDLLKPRPAAGEIPGEADIANRRTLQAGLAGLTSEGSVGSCSPYVDIRVPLRSSGAIGYPTSYRLVTRARAGGAFDYGQVRLLCIPSR